MSEDIDKIIARYLDGSLTSEDEIKLEKWLSHKKNRSQQLSTIEQIWKTPFSYPGIVNMKDERDKIVRRLKGEQGNGLEQRLKAVPSYKTILRYAAVLLAFTTLAFIVLIYTEPYAESPKKSTIIERNNPAGQKSKIQLPDGSIVWLNAASKLSYSSDFNSNSRKLMLEGEAYFEVTENPQIPFEVYTEDLIITAIGTSFNVNTFQEDKEEIALNTGKIRIECVNKCITCVPGYLNPGEMALYNPTIGKIMLTEFEGQDPFVWKDGKIVFKYATFDQVLAVLARWYNVEFEIIGDLQREWSYSSTFDNEVLENVLASLKVSEEIDYQLNGATIKIFL